MREGHSECEVTRPRLNRPWVCVLRYGKETLSLGKGAGDAGE